MREEELFNKMVQEGVKIEVIDGSLKIIEMIYTTLYSFESFCELTNDIEIVDYLNCVFFELTQQYLNLFEGDEKVESIVKSCREEYLQEIKAKKSYIRYVNRECDEEDD